MHVLQLGPYPPPHGGINRNMLAIRERLLESGHRCSIIATSRSTEVSADPDVYHPRSATELLRLLRRLNYDLLHLHVGGEITARVLRLMLACGFFARGRNVLSVHSGGYPSSTAAKRARPGSIRGAIFRRFARVIAVNQMLAEVIELYGVAKKKIAVIYPFVEQNPDPNIQIPRHLSEFAERHTPFLLSVGLLEPEYDLFTQIKALQQISAEFPEAGLMVVGSGSLQGQLHDAAGSNPNILLAGDVEPAVTLHLINQADMLVRTTQYDGDAISVREALFLDTPVIATDNGMRPDGVHLVPVGDSSALSDQIRWLARREKAQKEPKPTDTRNIDEILRLYEDLV